MARIKLQYSLRSLLILLSICSCAFAVVSWFYAVDRRERNAIAAAERIGCWVQIETRDNAAWMPRHRVATAVNFYRDCALPEDISFLVDMPDIRTLGFEALPVDDHQMRWVSALKQLETLNLSRSKITDEGLALLSNCPNLKCLWITATPVGGAAFSEPDRFTNLSSLFAEGAPFDDDGLQNLSRLPKLTTLRLSSELISDRGLMNLSGATELRSLELTGKFSIVGVRALRTLPDLYAPFLSAEGICVLPYGRSITEGPNGIEEHYTGDDIWPPRQQDLWPPQDVSGK